MTQLDNPATLAQLQVLVDDMEDQLRLAQLGLSLLRAQLAVLMLRSWTCGLPTMYSPSSALTLTAYLLTRTATRLPTMTDQFTYAY
jgi:hypothetical protein